MENCLLLQNFNCKYSSDSVSSLEIPIPLDLRVSDILKPIYGKGETPNERGRRIISYLGYLTLQIVRTSPHIRVTEKSEVVVVV